MTRVLLTGMSGAGKSTVLAELARRGWLTVDTDYDGWVGPNGDWDERRMAALLSSTPTVIVSGTVANQGMFYDRFEHVVLLSAPLDVLLARIAGRTNNPYGSTPEQLEEIRRNTAEVEPLLRDGASLELDATRPVTELADCLEQLLHT